MAPKRKPVVTQMPSVKKKEAETPKETALPIHKVNEVKAEETVALKNEVTENIVQEVKPKEVKEESFSYVHTPIAYKELEKDSALDEKMPTASPVEEKIKDSVKEKSLQEDFTEEESKETVAESKKIRTEEVHVTESFKEDISAEKQQAVTMDQEEPKLMETIHTDELADKEPEYEEPVLDEPVLEKPEVFEEDEIVYEYEYDDTEGLFANHDEIPENNNEKDDIQKVDDKAEIKKFDVAEEVHENDVQIENEKEESENFAASDNEKSVFMNDSVNENEEEDFDETDENEVQDEQKSLSPADWLKKMRSSNSQKQEAMETDMEFDFNATGFYDDTPTAVEAKPDTLSKQIATKVLSVAVALFLVIAFLVYYA